MKNFNFTFKKNVIFNKRQGIILNILNIQPSSTSHTTLGFYY